MTDRSVRIALVLGVIAFTVALPAAAQENFLWRMFGGFGAPPPLVAPSRPAARPRARVPVVEERAPRRHQEARRKVAHRTGGDKGDKQAWCVRTCDGRSFPLGAAEDDSRVALCNNFCPASTTEVVFGSAVDDAKTERGKSYSELPNAFRYRTEIVDGCTCNGKDQFGVAAVSVETDPTLRKGDMVASGEGLMVTKRRAGKHAEAKFSPASARVSAKYRRAPVVASDSD